MAKTARFCLCCKMKFPKDSIKVLFPTPGTPVIPMRQALLFKPKQSCNNLFASNRSSGRLLSIKVMAALKAVLSC